MKSLVSSDVSNEGIHEAWEGLKRSLRGQFEDSVWAHLSGTVSAPFQAGDHGQVAVKVVDDRGNELMVVKSLSEVEK